MLGAGCSAPVDESGGTSTGTSSSTTTDAPTGGVTSCRFPTFARAETWLRTTDEGNCDGAAAQMFGVPGHLIHVILGRDPSGAWAAA